MGHKMLTETGCQPFIRSLRHALRQRKPLAQYSSPAVRCWGWEIIEPIFLLAADEQSLGQTEESIDSRARWVT